MSAITELVLPTGLTYADYRQQVDDLYAQGKATGDNHSDAILHYTKLNVARMRRLDKKTKMLPETEEAMTAIERPLRLITLTEGWCGDAAQIVPIIEKMTALNPNIEHEILLRDQNLDFMDHFLTNGARAIPITVIIDAGTHKVLGHWGPRPADAQNLVMTAKAEAEAATIAEDRQAIMDVAKLETQKWYTRDKGRAVQEEFVAALQEALSCA